MGGIKKTRHPSKVEFDSFIFIFFLGFFFIREIMEDFLFLFCDNFLLLKFQVSRIELFVFFATEKNIYVMDNVESVDGFFCKINAVRCQKYVDILRKD